jgi:hypothetical protein
VWHLPIKQTRKLERKSLVRTCAICDWVVAATKGDFQRRCGRVIWICFKCWDVPTPEMKALRFRELASRLPEDYLASEYDKGMVMAKGERNYQCKKCDKNFGPKRGEREMSINQFAMA